MEKAVRRPHWIAVTVLLVVGLVVGLLLPAINQVREAAARMNCHGHLKQLAVALHSYADRSPPVNHEQRAGVAFPAGTVPNPELMPDSRLSWYVSVLPHIEQDEVFKRFDQRFGPAHPSNRKAAENRFRHLVCPASDECERDDRGEKWKSPTPVTHYVGVAGVGPDAAALPLGHPRAGVFGYDRRTALSADGIPDGSSNTLLLIETAQNPGHWAFGGTATVRGIEPGTAPYIGPGHPFGGFHGRGTWFAEPPPDCTAAFADGSVRTLPHTIAPEVLEALATVGGKETLPSSW